MTFHHVAPSKGFFLTEKNLCFKNFLFKKFYFLIVLAVFSTACSSGSSDSSSGSSGDSSPSSDTPKDQKKADPKPAIPLPQCLKKTLDVQSIDKGQTKKLSYSCSIAQELRKQTLTISHTPNSAIKLAPTQIAIPNEEKLKGAFTVKGLEINSTVRVSINIADTEDLQFTVTQPTIPKASQLATTVFSTDSSVPNHQDSRKRLLVFKDKLYYFSTHYYVTSDGTTWTKTTKDDINFPNTFEGGIVVFKEKIMAIVNSNVWFASEKADGSLKWTKHDEVLIPGFTKGQAVVLNDQVYLMFGDKKTIRSSSDGLKWQTVYTHTNARFLYTDPVVKDGKIWIMGGNEESSSLLYYDDVFSFDGTTFTPEAKLLAKNAAYGATVFEDGIWLAAGYNTAGYDKLWYSPYGTFWHEVKTGLPFSGFIRGLVSWKGKLWTVSNGKVYTITYTK